MTFISNLVQTVVFGLIEGSVIAIGAVGMTLSYGVTGFINFAYGEFMAYGAYISLFLMGGMVGLSFPATIPIAIVIVAILGVGVSRIFFEPLSDRGPIPLLITSIGVGMFLRYVLAASVGVSDRSFPLPLMRSEVFFGIRVTPKQLAVVAAAVLAMIAIHLILTRTMLGKTMRATSGNKELAEVAGINTTSVVRKTWLISAGAGALAGILYTILFAPIRPLFGFHFLIIVVTAVIVGGIGRTYGAILGAYIVAITINLGSFYLSSSYSITYAFIVLVGILLVKPEGIRGSDI